VAVFTNDAEKVMVCERSDVRGAWQFPQGGIDSGESEEKALRRELREEIGTDAVEVVSTASSLVSYDFPENMKAKVAEQWRGQTQRWFLVRFRPGHLPDLSKSDGEFVNFKWTTVQDALAGIVDWKQDAYRQGLRLLGLLKS